MNKTQVQLVDSIKNVDKLIYKWLQIQSKTQDLPVLSKTQIMVLKCFDENKTSIKQKDLEKILKLRRSTISGILDTMEKNHLIIRNIDPNDTRGNIIRLSNASLDLKDKIKTILNKLECMLRQGLTEEDIYAFIKVVNIIESNVHSGIVSEAKDEII